MMHMESKYTWVVAKQYGSTWYEWTKKMMTYLPFTVGSYGEHIAEKNL